MLEATAAIVREVNCSLAMLNQSSSDRHAASLSTALTLIENITQHVVNFFAIAPTPSEGSITTEAERTAFLHATDGLLYALLSTPSSLLELCRLSSSSTDAFVASASSQESKYLKESLTCLCVIVELGGGRLTGRQVAMLRRLGYDIFARLTRTNTHHAVQSEAVRLLLLVVEAAAPADSTGVQRLPAAEVDLARTIEAIDRCTARTTVGQGARGGALRLLGALADAFPAESLPFLSHILSIFRRTMESLSAKAEPDQFTGEGIMLGLNLLLNNFGSHQETETSIGALLFPFTKCALQIPMDAAPSTQARYRFTKAALKLLKHHAMLMRIELHRDAIDMFRLLRSLCGHKNIELHKGAYPAAMAFLEAYAFTACHSGSASTPSPSRADTSHLAQLLALAKESMVRVNLEPYELSIAVSAYGALARPLSHLLTPLEMMDMFCELSSKCQALLDASEAEMESAARYLPQFLVTYASVIREIPAGALVGDVRGQSIADAVHQLMDAVLLLFPRQYYFPKQRMATPTALMKLLLACSKHPAMLGRACVRFVERGLTLSMGSSSMFRDTKSKMPRDDGAAPDEPLAVQQEGALYEEYAPLWCGLLSTSSNVSSWPFPWSSVVSEEEVASQCLAVRWELLRCAVRCIESFDLHCAIQLQHPQAFPQTSPVFLTDHSALNAGGGGAVTPRTPKDYSLFLCLVPLFKRLAPLLLAVDVGSLNHDEEVRSSVAEWALVLVRACTDRTVMWPHVSGYFTLVESIVTSVPLDIFTQRRELADALAQFHDVASHRIADYSRELLFACSSCLAAFPAPVLVSLPQLTSPLKTLLQMGVEYEPAALRAIEALEQLLHNHSDEIQAILPSLIPLLTGYVTHGSDSTDNAEKAGRVHLARRATEIVGHAGLRLAAAVDDLTIDGTAHSSTETQMRLVQLDADYSLRLVLPMRDTTVDMPVGMIVPRVLALTSSTCRQTRVAASEMLHAIVLWVVGTINLRPLDAPGDPAEVLRVLFPAVLELSASTDDAVAELFSSLATQLSHWYAQCPCGDLQHAARGPSQLLDAAFEGLRGGARGANAAIRTVSAHIVTEYLRWAAKNPRNFGVDATRLALRRFSGLCHHPSSHERLGAATCFNRFYPVFREMNSAVISEHTLDVLFHLLSALLLEPDDSTSGASVELRDAIVHMEKIVVFHSALLIAPDPARGGQLLTLSEAVTWLFQQCGSTQKLCRSLAMRLFTIFASCLPGFETEEGPSRWLTMSGQSTDIFSGVFSAFSIQDPHLKVCAAHTSLSLTAFLEWSKELEASVACHLWLLAARYMSPFVAFGRRPDRPSKKLRTEVVLGGCAIGGSPHKAGDKGKSQLPAHLWAFFHALTAQKVRVEAADSQAVWLEDDDDTPAPSVPPTGCARAMSSRILSVLEAAACLYEVMVERYPSCLWTESDIDSPMSSPQPLLHKALYTTVASLALCPRRILGDLGTTAGEQRRVQDVALRLSKACLAASQGEHSVAERSSLEAAIVSAVPPSLRADMPALCQAVAQGPMTMTNVVTGLRTLQRLGFSSLSDSVVASHSTKQALDSRTTLRLQDCVAHFSRHRYLLCSPLMQTFFAEFAGLLLQSGVDVQQVISLVINEEDEAQGSDAESRQSSMRNSGVALQRMSTSALVMRQLQAGRRLWSGALRGELEQFLAAHKSKVLDCCLNHFRHARAVEDESIQRQQHIKTAVMELMRTLLLSTLRNGGCSPRETSILWLRLFDEDEENASERAETLLPLRIEVATAFLQAPFNKAEPLELRVFVKLVEELRRLLNPTLWACSRHELLRSPPAARWVIDGAKLLGHTALRSELVASNWSEGTSDEWAAMVASLKDVVHHSLQAWILHELPLSWQEVPLGSVEWDTYRSVLRHGVIDVLPSVVKLFPTYLFEVLPLLGDCTHPFRGLLINSLDKAISLLSPAQLPEVVQTCFLKQRLALPVVIRQSITHHISLPCIRRLPPSAASSLYAENVGELFRQVESTSFGSTETVAAANTLCVTRTSAFVLLATMYRTSSPEDLRGEINRAFIATSLSQQQTSSGKELTEKLLRSCLQARSFNPVSSPVSVDATLLLQYRQAAFTCLVSVVVATQRQEKLFVEFLLKERNHDLWHRIVDCNAHHAFTVETRFDEVPQQLTMVRTDWELQSTTSVGDAEGSLNVPRTQHAAGTKRVRYLSSQYLHDSHVGFGFGKDDGGLDSPSPPSSAAAPGDKLLDDVVTISATPRQHRDMIKASMQLELDHNLTHNEEDSEVTGGVLHRHGGAQPFDRLAASSASRLDFSLSAPPDGILFFGDASVVEIDSVWLSSCSNTLLYLMDALIRLFPSSTSTAGFPLESTQGGSAAHTSWTQAWLSVFTAADTHINVKLVQLRLMTLRADYFDRFAGELFEPLVGLATDPSIGQGLHYICRDVLLLFLRWRTPLPPHHPTSEAVANKLLSHVVRSISHKTRRVIRNNFEILKLIIERWKGRCHIDAKDLLGWLTYDETHEGAHLGRMCGVQICGILAANEISIYNPRYDAGVVAEEVIMRRLVQNMGFTNKDVALASAEVIGMTLRYLQKVSTTMDDRSAVLRAATSEKLWAMYTSAAPARFLVVLRRIAEHCPDVLDEFLPSKVMQLFHSLAAADDQVMVFELFGMRCEKAEMLFPPLHAHVAMLGTMRPLLKVALYELLLLLFPRLSGGLLSALVKTFLRLDILQEHLSNVVDARVAFYKICIGVTDQRRSDLDEGLLPSLQQFLVLGLEDPSIFIRDVLIRYWDHDDRLSVDGSVRFSQLLSKVLRAVTTVSASGAPDDNEELDAQPQMRAAEETTRAPVVARGSTAWVQHAAVLMLSLCHRSPDFGRTDALFPQPLKHCHFRSVAVRTETVASSGLPSLAPMFSSQVPIAQLSRTPASLGGHTTRRTDGEDGPSQGGSQSRQAGLLMATQENRLFPSTQEGLFNVFTRTVAPSAPTSQLLFRPTPSSLSSSVATTAAATFAAPAPHQLTSSQFSAPVELRRRFVKTAEDDAVRTHIMHASRLRQERSVQLGRLREQRAQHVILYRAYRAGEVPDVQIALQSLVVPWQALLLHDADLARTTITCLGRSLLNKMHEIATSASGPKAGGPASHTVPASATTFLVDIPGALSVQVARQTKEELRQLLVEVFHPSRMWCIPQPVSAVCQELLLACSGWDEGAHTSAPSGGQAGTIPSPLLTLPAPDHILGSAMPRAGEAPNHEILCSALLLLEQQLPVASLIRTRCSPTSAKYSAAWSAYYLSLLHHREVHKGHCAARKLLPNEWTADFENYLLNRRAGDWDGAVRNCRCMLELPGGDVAARDVVSYEAGEALAAMLRWDDISSNSSLTSLSQCTTQVLLTTKAHAVQQVIHAHAMQGAHRGGTHDASMLLNRLPPDTFTLQRALDLISKGDFIAAADAARRGIHEASLSFSCPGDPVGHRAGLLSLHALTALAGAADALVFMKARPREAVSVLHKQITRFVASIPTHFAADSPGQWDVLLRITHLLSEHTKSSFATFAKAEPSRQLVEELALLQQQLHITAAAALSESSHGVLAARSILSRPSAHLKLECSESSASAKASSRYQLWSSVMRTTMSRVFFLPPPPATSVSAASSLRKVWGELLTATRSKRESDAAITTGVVSVEEHAGLEATLWMQFSSALIATEGCNQTNAAELAAMCQKAHEKTLTYTSWLAAQEPTSSAPKQEKLLLQLLHVQDQLHHQHAEHVSNREKERSPIRWCFAQLLLRLIVDFRSVDASRIFPRLIEIIDEEAKENSLHPSRVGQLLAEQSSSIPTTAVLPWCAQILSALSRPSTGAAVAVLARRLAVHHPQVVFYPFCCAKDDLVAAVSRFSPDNVVSQTVHFLSTAFAQEPTLSAVRTFARELHALHNPELRVRQWLNELRRILPGSQFTLKAQDVFRQMWMDCFEPSVARGTVNAQFASKYGKSVRAALCTSHDSPPALDPTLAAGDARSWKDKIDKLASELRPLVETAGLQPLSSFSQDLGRMQLSHYGTDYVLLPQQPGIMQTAGARIVGFDSNVLVLSSQQKPKRLRLFSSNEHVHAMLVKGGEDLRLDQRVQQLFVTMNHILRTAQSRRMITDDYHGYPLAIRTYPVIPVSKRLGLIGWVPDTIVLKELMERQMRRDPYAAADVAHHPATREYRGVFETPGSNPIDRYVVLYRDAPNTKGQYTHRMEGILSMINPNYLADGLRSMAATAAEYYDIRGRWATSLGTLSVASYVLGIGDRHLENFLIDKSTGTLVSIDFGHAFGSATTTLPIPELMPFRLSPQMYNALGPLGTDCIAGPMETTLTALHQHRAFLQTLAATFLHEPLLDWEGASKLTSSDGDAAGGVAGADVARTKLESFYRKLRLENPVEILAADIARNNKVRHHGVLADVLRVARGEPAPRIPSSMPDARLHTRAFVQVLLEMSTDLNVLGRTWAGWSPLF